MGKRLGSRAQLFDGQAATGVSAMVDVSSFQHIVLTLAGEGTPTATVKLRGSVAHSILDVDLSQAADKDNPWDYVATYDLQDAAKINGDDGLSFAGSNEVRQLLVNTDHIKALALEVSAYTAGQIYAWVDGSDNG